MSKKDYNSRFVPRPNSFKWECVLCGRAGYPLKYDDLAYQPMWWMNDCLRKHAFKCDQCPRRYTKQSSLSNHLKTHKGS